MLSVNVQLQLIHMNYCFSNFDIWMDNCVCIYVIHSHANESRRTNHTPRFERSPTKFHSILGYRLEIRLLFGFVYTRNKRTTQLFLRCVNVNASDIFLTGAYDCRSIVAQHKYAYSKSLYYSVCTRLLTHSCTLSHLPAAVEANE